MKECLTSLPRTRIVPGINSQSYSRLESTLILISPKLKKRDGLRAPVGNQPSCGLLTRGGHRRAGDPVGNKASHAPALPELAVCSGDAGEQTIAIVPSVRRGGTGGHRILKSRLGMEFWN